MFISMVAQHSYCAEASLNQGETSLHEEDQKPLMIIHMMLMLG
jgi:hypothetical protein